MWRHECVVANIGTCGTADQSLKLLLSHQVASVIFIFIPHIYSSCLTLPPAQILIFNSMSTPQEHKILKAKVMADMARAKAMMAEIAQVEEEEKRAAEEAV